MRLSILLTGDSNLCGWFCDCQRRRKYRNVQKRMYNMYATVETFTSKCWNKCCAFSFIVHAVSSNSDTLWKRILFLGNSYRQSNRLIRLQRSVNTLYQPVILVSHVKLSPHIRMTAYLYPSVMYEKYLPYFLLYRIFIVYIEGTFSADCYTIASRFHGRGIIFCHIYFSVTVIR